MNTGKEDMPFARNARRRGTRSNTSHQYGFGL
jgi:hypothetical protein